MPVAVCPSCAARIKAPDAAAGRTVACPRCRAAVAVPAASANPTTPPVPSAAGPGFDGVEDDAPAFPPPPFARPTPQQFAPPDPAPTPATRPCPFCAEDVRIEAKKCRHCGETLDAAMRAAEEERRAAERPAPVAPQRRARQDEAEARPTTRRQPAPAPGCLGCVSGLVGLPLLAGGVIVVFLLIMSWQQRETLNEATRLYDQGQRDAAIPKYKSAFAFAGDERPAILKRIVSYDLARGDTAEAEKWVKRGFTDKLDVAFDEPAATAIQARLAGEKAARAAQDKAVADAREQVRRQEEEARAKERKAEQAAKDKEKQGPQSDKDKVKANRRLPRDQLRALIYGRGPDEVVRLIGRPDQTSDIEGVGSSWTYQGIGLDVNTGRLSDIAVIEFDGAGLVSGVSFS